MSPGFDPFVSRIVEGVRGEAQRYGLLLTLGQWVPGEGMVERKLLANLTKRSAVYGLLLVFPPKRARIYFERPPSRMFPMLAVGGRNYSDRIPAALIDYSGGVRQALLRLLGKGHRRIGFVRGRSDFEGEPECFGTYRRVLAMAGIPFDPDLVRPGDGGLQSGIRAARRWEGMKNGPTAVLATGELAAIGVLEELKRLGREKALAVIGLGDVEYAFTVNSSLTMVGGDPRGWGSLIARKLRRLMTDPEDGNSTLQLETHLYERGSG